MTGAISASLCVVGALSLILQTALAQQCYYPNGAKANEKPCSSASGSACCPDKWECLDNGLCHYPHNNLFGRYSCTDKTWKAAGCASNMCTYDMKAVGGESITQCSGHGNQWCCNADAQHVDCCNEQPVPRPFFKLQDGQIYAVIGSSTASNAPTLSNIIGLATSGGSAPSSTVLTASSSDSSSTPSSTPSSTTNTPSSSSTLTSLSTTVSSGPSGPTTIVQTQTVVTSDPSSTSSPATSLTPEKQSKIPLIIGCAIGIPLALAFLAIMFWLLRKRARQSHINNEKNPYDNDALAPKGSSTSPDFAGGAALTGFKGGHRLHEESGGLTTSEKVSHNIPAGYTELESQSVGPDRPISMVPGSAELDSGGKFRPGTVPHAPHLVGLGGGNGAGGNAAATAGYPEQGLGVQGVGSGLASGITQVSPAMTSASWGSAPPGYTYSPGMNQGQNRWTSAHERNLSGGHMLDANTSAGATSSVAEGAGTGVGSGAVGSATGSGYIAYRPPAGHEAYTHHGVSLSNVPEVAELSAVESPPAVVEAADARTPPTNGTT